MKACVEISAGSCLVGPNHDNGLINDLVFHEVTDIGDLFRSVSKAANSREINASFDTNASPATGASFRPSRISVTFRFPPPSSQHREIFSRALKYLGEDALLSILASRQRVHWMSPAS
jgi:hypothetical protein